MPDAMASAEASLSGSIDVTLVTLHTSEKNDQEVAQINLTDAKAAVTSASNYWSTISKGKLSLFVGTVRTSVLVDVPSYSDFSVLMDKAQAAVGWVAGPNKVLMIMIPRNDIYVYGASGNIGAGWSTGATSGRILLPYTSSLTGPVLSHEMGHIFNLDHANTLECGDGIMDTLHSGDHFTDGSCTSKEYGDDTDIMGITRAAEPYLNAYLFDYGHFGNGTEILDLGKVTGVKGFTLTPWASGGANSALKFVDSSSGETYYVQYRTNVGYDAATAVGGNFGVQIIKAGTSPSQSLTIAPSTLPYTANGGYYNPNLAWQTNSSFVTVGGIRINMNWENGANAGVTIVAPAFNDLAGSGFQTDITWMKAQNLTTGYPDGSFHPFDSMSREAMAAFMYRLAGSPAYTPPTTSPFSDVATASVFYKEITWMNSVGLTTGYADGTFRPGAGMARDAMAAFLFRYASVQCHIPAAETFPMPDSARFTDVAPAAMFYREVGWLANAGISTGYPDNTFKPTDLITREAVAAFIHRLSTYVSGNGGCL
ncbi:MAG: S-layer homology domain-containing protein [Acidobacteria bacterium]|nr:S-layer homology domain-containing protein [Acidobacteriota bacterium]